MAFRQFKRQIKMGVFDQLTNLEREEFGKGNDVGQVVKKNPGFDPVFMKV